MLHESPHSHNRYTYSPIVDAPTPCVPKMTHRRAPPPRTKQANRNS